MSEINQETRIFSLSGNHLSLDFINTLDDRMDIQPSELLASYSDLVSWSQQTGNMTDEEAQVLLKEATQHPAKAEKVRQQAITLREALFRIFARITDDADPDEVDVQFFNAALAGALSKVCVVPEGDGFGWDWNEKGIALDRMLWPVIRATADLMTSKELRAVRICASEDCAWLFLDTSKNHTRRWCDMKTCGNRVKVSRHYERKKQDVRKG